MEFHISRLARDRYKFDQSLFRYSGNVIFANFHAARIFAQKMNQRRDLVQFPEQAVKAGQINAMGLIDEILHHVVQMYREQKNPEVMQEALKYLAQEVGDQALERTLAAFTGEFPPIAVFKGELTVDEYLQGETEGISNRAVALEEMLMLWIANKNPAFNPFQELFDDDRLSVETAYPRVLRDLHAFFEKQPKFGPDNQNLIDMLRAPALNDPNSLEGQLNFIRRRWSELLGRYLYRLLSSLDLILEEHKMGFLGGPGPVPIPIYDLAAAEAEPERFSLDRDWMVRLVLIAKNTYVWLDQLSQQYGASITRLDQIPDEELEKLARWGFTGLWLIGLWERSEASAIIKKMMGNPEAIASAYSLASYNIAADLGGEDAYRNLNERARRYGIRLASDMVPNHMGIDSSWVVDHPERFISQDYSPFPSYTFNGPNLSPTDRVGIYLEDHYYDHTDAAVVFKRVDHDNGATQYIYHGNDGTSMPWNDTAQLDYLKPEVREAIIQTILDVARRFSIIRFDAAMTLTKRHYQRLWFPQPGTGGDIPSRAEHSMTKEQFDAAMPEEFWREVVDRAAVEAPDTLLLAEAFWLMEGYFVRSLGMHRVYNSAFMNMMRNEDNAKYRQVMKNTLEFEPEIMKRFVNFMNNPDERTAVDQFGKGDKYFGTAVMLVTLPGLPMFGHGQVQGFSEKYGMEFRRAYWNEFPDPYLIERHEREVFPLMHRRAEFAGVDNFLLYDFFNQAGFVDEDVYAYSNGVGDHHNLVVFHNKFSDTAGWVRMSAGYMDRSTKTVVQRSLAEGLGLHPAEDTFVVFRDSITNLEYIRPSLELQENGLFLQLGAFNYHAFLDFRQVQDNEFHSYRQLSQYLSGSGVPSVEGALKELVLQPVQHPFRQIANPGYFQYLLDNRLDQETAELPEALLKEAAEKTAHLLDGIQFLTGDNQNKDEILTEVQRRLEALLSLPALEKLYPVPRASKAYPKAVDYVREGLEDHDERWLALFGWVFVQDLGKLTGTEDFQSASLSWIEEWQLARILKETYQSMDIEEGKAARLVDVVRMLVAQQNWYTELGKKPLRQVLQSWLSNDTVQRFVGVNRYKDVLWFNQEAFDEFAWWMAAVSLFEAAGRQKTTAGQLVEQTLDVHEIVQSLLEAEEQSDYKVEKLLEALKE